MWIFTIYGFFSISTVGDVVWVRARNRLHLAALCRRFGHPGPILVTPPPSDYGWRLRLTRSEWLEDLILMAQEQDWTNFKGEAKKRRLVNAGFLLLLHRIWALCFDYQLAVQRTERRRAAEVEHSASIEEVINKINF